MDGHKSVVDIHVQTTQSLLGLERTLDYLDFWLVECRMICKNTNALCINIHCSSLQQKGEVILYILVLRIKS